MPCLYRYPSTQRLRCHACTGTPGGWYADEVQIHLADDVKQVRHERAQTEQRLKRLGRAYVDGLYDHDGYRREKRSLEDKLANLVVPGVDAAMEAGKLLENLPVLWEEGDLAKRRKLLMAMLDAVHVDAIKEKSVVAIRPNPAFRPIFELATTREGSGIVLITQTPQAQGEPGASESCSWWRRGRVQPPSN